MITSKHFIYALITFCMMCVVRSGYSQTNCSTAQPFCTTTSTVFPATQNTSAQAGPDYGCLYSQPNPAWYFMQVANPGTIVLDISGSANQDVDFICWGPFSSLSGACNNLTSSNTVDCSYSSSYTETCTISNAQAGQYYMVLITNYSNAVQNINFSADPSSVGSTNCGILSSTNSQTICLGATATVSVQTTIGSPTYTWMPGNYNTSTINVSPSATTIYTVTVAGTNTATSTYTSQVVTSTVTVVNPPTVTMSNGGPYCSGASAVLTASANGVTSYSWTGPGGYSSTTTSGSATITNIQTSSAGVFTVTVHNSNGCVGTATTNVSISPSPTVTVGSNSPLCSGATLSLTATGGATYAWSGPSAFSSAQQNPSLVTTGPVNSGVYTVTITTAAGCSVTRTVSVVVNALPTPTITSNSPVCAGTTLSFSTTSGTGYTYSWSGPGGYTSTVQNPSITNATTAQSGVYSVTVSNSGCVGTASASATVNPLPVPTIGSNSPVCAGTTMSLTSNGGTSYNWSGPNGFTSPQQNPVLTPASVSNGGVYTVTVTALGCSATATVNVNVTASIPAIMSSIDTCLNAQVTLNAPAGGTTYNWTGPNGFTSTQQSPVISGVTAANNGVYSVTITIGAAGCTSTGTLNLSTISAVSYSVVPTNTAICYGKMTSLSVLGQGGTGTYAYNWAPATGINNPSMPSVIASPQASQDYTVTLTDVNCPVAPTPTLVVTVTVNPLPVMTFSTPVNEGCEPFMAQVDAQSTPPSTNCSWKFTNNLAASGCNTSVIFPTHGTYNATLTVTDINGCVDSLAQPGFVVVDPKPVPDFDWNPTNPTILTNDVNFYDRSTVGLPMKAWSWNFDDYYTTIEKDTSHHKDPDHLFNEIGSYNVMLKVTNTFECVDSVVKTVVVDDEFAMYIPNAFTPSRPDGLNDVFLVKGMGFLSDSFEMRIYDRWGEQIFRTTDVFKGWDGSVKGGARAKQDVYIYKITVKDFRLKVRTFTGHVTLL